VTRDSLAAQIWLAISCVDARRSTDISNGSGMAVARSARRSTAFLEQPICRGRNQTMQRFPRQTMRISFSTPGAARAAVAILEQYGFSANQTGKDVVTNCPTLLAAPAIERSIGLELVEGIEFSTGAPRNGAS
jgi:hypothetical protein